MLRYFAYFYEMCTLLFMNLQEIYMCKHIIYISCNIMQFIIISRTFINRIKN